MLLAGVPVPDRLALEVAARLRLSGFADTARTLEDAYESEHDVVSLTIDDREAILSALEDCPYGLADLRSVLLLEREWRVAEGLVSPAAPAVG